MSDHIQNTEDRLNDDQLNRLDVEEQSPFPMGQDHTHASASTTPSAYVTTAALEEVKNSIQELRSILLRARGGAFDEAATELEMNQRGRDPRQSREIPGEHNDDMGSVRSFSTPPPPTTIIIQAPTAGAPIVPMPSPIPQPGPVIVRPRSFRSSRRSRSSSRTRIFNPPQPPTIIVQPQGPPIVHTPIPRPQPVPFILPPFSPISRPSSPQPIVVQPPPPYFNTPGTGYPRRTDTTGRNLEPVIDDFSSIITIATFLGLVSIVILGLARSIYDSSDLQKSSLNKAFNIVLQVSASLALSFNLSVAIVAGGAASTQALRLRRGQRASDIRSKKTLDTKLQLCSTMRYYGLLCLTIATACIFALLLNSPYAVLMIIPVVGVVFYDSLFRDKVSLSSTYY